MPGSEKLVHFVGRFVDQAFGDIIEHGTAGSIGPYLPRGPQLPPGTP